MSSGAPIGLRIERVDWSDPRAQGLQDLLARQMYARYASRVPADPDRAALISQALAVDPADVVATLLVRTPSARPSPMAACACFAMSGRSSGWWSAMTNAGGASAAC